MSAVHGPMPCSAVSVWCAASASSFGQHFEIEPLGGDLARDDLQRLDLGRRQAEPAEPVGARLAQGVMMNGSNAASTRAQIAAALAVDTCWPQTMAARPAKPGSRRRSAGMPVSSRTASAAGPASPAHGRRLRGRTGCRGGWSSSARPSCVRLARRLTRASIVLMSFRTWDGWPGQARP